MRPKYRPLNELLVTHIAGQAGRDATYKKEKRRCDEDKNELQLAEARWADCRAETSLRSSSGK